ncbi:MAG: hypothetical protein IKX96_01530 [Firmicutes bacterium]|nr:hypothetical protein [Bacillota bacterium]
MATSSIFHTVKIDTPEKAEAFVAALEASEKDPWVRISQNKHTVETNPQVIKHLFDLNRQSGELTKKEL